MLRGKEYKQFRSVYYSFFQFSVRSAPQSAVDDCSTLDARQDDIRVQPMVLSRSITKHMAFTKGRELKFHITDCTSFPDMLHGQVNHLESRVCSRRLH